MILVALLIAAPLLLSPWLAHKLERAVAENCASCEFSIDGFDVSLLRPGFVVMTGVRMQAGSKAIAQIEARIPRLEARLALAPLFKKMVEIKSLLIEAPEVTF